MPKLRKPFKKIMKFSNTYKNWPIVTCVLIAICVVVFIIQTQVPDSVWIKYAFVPANALSKPWTFITFIFLHGSLDHLILNMTGFAFFGYYVETAIGRKGILTVFLLAGVLSSLGATLTATSTTASLGASGAITGVLGFLAVIKPDYPVRYFLFPLVYRPAIVAAVSWGIIDLFFQFTSPGTIAYGGHLAGLMAGGLFGALWRFSTKSKK